jgi:hypothetical protein
VSNKEYLIAITNILGIRNMAKIIEIKNNNGTHNQLNINELIIPHKQQKKRQSHFLSG